MTVDDVITQIMEREGWDTFTDKKDDRGGPTKFGITAPFLADYLGVKPSDHSRAWWVEEIRNLTEPDARACYKDNLLRREGFGVITDARVLSVVLDAATNHGASAARKLVQRALHVNPDGKWGPITLAEIRDSSPIGLAVRILTQRARLYARIVQGNLEDADHDGIPDNVEMLGGWINRTMDQIEELIA